MIKFKQGWIQTKEGVRKDIVVKAKTPNSLTDMLIGGGITLIGITYLTVSAFKNGSKMFAEAESQTMDDLGLFCDSLDD